MFGVETSVVLSRRLRRRSRESFNCPMWATLGMGWAVRKHAASSAAIDDRRTHRIVSNYRAALCDVSISNDTFVVFVSVPFACVGGILALWLREMPLSVSAAVGFITLSGVSVLNSMIIVSHLRSHWSGQGSLEKALETTTMSCLRTVMMTALVASVGFIPWPSHRYGSRSPASPGNRRHWGGDKQYADDTLYSAGPLFSFE